MSEPALRSAWRESASGRGRLHRESWRTPGVDAVVSALVGPASARTLRNALRLLAWEHSGGPKRDLDALLTEIDALWSILEPAELAPVARRDARRWTVDAWVDAVAAHQGAPCVDPLSGLHTPEYLLGRVRELDRAVGDGAPPDLALVAVRWPEPNGPWLRIATVVRVAATLVDCVRPDATLCQAGTHTAIAMVPDDGSAATERAAVERCLTVEGPRRGMTVELIAVPARRDEIGPLIERLREEPEDADSSRMRTADKSVD